MHRIDAGSPLCGLDGPALQRLNAELVVAFAGVDETLERPVHARHSWPVERIAFGRCFEDMLEHQADATHIHWESLDRTSPCSLTG